MFSVFLVSWWFRSPSFCRAISRCRDHRRRDEFGDVADLEAIVRLDAVDAVLEHRHAEGAGGGKHLRARLQRFIDTRPIDPAAARLLHEEAAAAAAAAE